MNISMKQLFGVGISFTVILIVVVIFIRKDIREHKSLSFKNPFQTHRRKPVSVNDVRYIAPWMTFDYVTKVFNLPNTYLKESLTISDTRYPFLTFSDYSKKINISDTTFVELVKNSVTTYITSSSTAH